jgi:hypothetical protein
LDASVPSFSQGVLLLKFFDDHPFRSRRWCASWEDNDTLTLDREAIWRNLAHSFHCFFMAGLWNHFMGSPEPKALKLDFNQCERMIKGGDLDPKEVTLCHVMRLFHVLQYEFPQATSWKLEEHGAHGLCYTLSFLVRFHQVAVHVLHDIEPREKLFSYAENYYDTLKEVVTVVVAQKQ